MAEIHRNRRDHAEPVPPVADAQSDEPAAWEQIENGRYMPRRIRGSYRGRALG
jgi:hypothetical protein